ncbi:MAG: hypothetical protein EOO90_02380 [Pedobacter sp.]|nr:MAG: hypothetical protein EOO90_02380 [Pedobacter sp.]
MELDFKTKQQLLDLLAKPSLVSEAHVDLLNDLVKAYPYYQPLHLLLAKASYNSDQKQNLIATASLYNGGALTYQMINNVKVLDKVSVAREEDDVYEEISEVETTLFRKESSDNEEVYEEINEVDVTAFARGESQSSPSEEHLSKENLPDEMAIESIVSADFFAFETAMGNSFSDAEEVLKNDNFNKSERSSEVQHPEEYDLEAETQSTVTKYDDDKLPYTFLWWLAKTRKEHEQIFQPYVIAKEAPTNQTGELQHQYVEHIFHLQTPFSVAEEASKGPLNLQNKSRGGDIIDSFIKNDPQIKAPKADQINTENKAKKSAEDNYDLVSETLATIYIEQMLYHKAIDTYEKLSLKFPEKSRYFADLIQSLEKKI